MSDDGVVCKLCESKSKPSNVIKQSFVSPVKDESETYFEITEMMIDTYICSRRHCIFICKNCGKDTGGVTLHHIVYCYLKKALSKFRNDGEKSTMIDEISKQMITIIKGSWYVVFGRHSILFYFGTQPTILINPDFVLRYTDLFHKIPQLLLLSVDYVDLVDDLLENIDVQIIGVEYVVIEKIMGGSFRCVLCGMVYDAFPGIQNAREHFSGCMSALIDVKQMG